MAASRSFFLPSWVDTRKVLLTVALFLIPLFQVLTIWSYTGDHVDESELVHFAVGFLGGDLNPAWTGYGHLPMYLLGVIYFVAGVLSVLLGKFDSFVDYGTQLLTNGYFFIVARYLFALSALAATLIYARIMRREGVQPVYIWLFVLVAVTAPSSIKYANYLRADTLVAFFVSVTLYAAMYVRGFRGALVVATATAAAFSCKISALPLLSVLGIIMLVRLRAGQCNWKHLLIVGVFFLILLFVFQPYYDLPGQLERVLSHYSDKEITISRVHYYGVAERISRIIQFHVANLGLPVSLLAVGSLAGLATRYAKLVGLGWLVVLSLILPYLFSSTLREYWFIPNYLLLRMLAFVCVAIIAGSLVKQMPERIRFIPVVLVVLATAYFPLNTAWSNYASLIKSQSAHPVSNKVQAGKWLKENYLGAAPIFMDGHYAHLYPKIFDPAHLKISRELSRLFIYDRHNNRFLASIFEDYIYSDYLDSIAAAKPPFTGLHRLRIDVDAETTFLDSPRVCSIFSGTCVESVLLRIKDIELLESTSSGYEMRITGQDPYLVFDPGAPIATDGSYFLRFSCDGRGGQVFFSFGEKFNAKNSTLYKGCQNQKITINDPARVPWVRKLTAGESPRELINKPGSMIFITSPAGYGRFYQIVRSSSDNSRIERAKKFIAHYERLMQGQPIQVFREGAGPTIEVWEVP